MPRWCCAVPCPAVPRRASTLLRADVLEMPPNAYALAKTLLAQGAIQAFLGDALVVRYSLSRDRDPNAFKYR